jgi:hypothetical protein
VAEYRDALPALRASVATLEAELADLEPELDRLTREHDALSREVDALQVVLDRLPPASAAPTTRLERALLVALIAPAVGGSALLLTLVLAGALGSLLLGKAGYEVGAVLSVPGGLYAAFRTARSIWRSGQVREP